MFLCDSASPALPLGWAAMHHAVNGNRSIDAKRGETRRRGCIARESYGHFSYEIRPSPIDPSASIAAAAAVFFFLPPPVCICICIYD